MKMIRRQRPVATIPTRDDAEQHREMLQAARRNGGICAGCGRAIADGETVWFERLAVDSGHGGVTHWWMPVGAECVSAALRHETRDAEPEACVGCGRGVYYQTSAVRRQRALCSRRCRPQSTSATTRVRQDAPRSSGTATA